MKRIELLVTFVLDVPDEHALDVEELSLGHFFKPFKYKPLRGAKLVRYETTAVEEILPDTRETHGKEK